MVVADKTANTQITPQGVQTTTQQIGQIPDQQQTTNVQIGGQQQQPQQPQATQTQQQLPSNQLPLPQLPVAQTPIAQAPPIRQAPVTGTTQQVLAPIQAPVADVKQAAPLNNKF